MWELLIANHLDQSLWSTNQKYWAAVRSNLLHSSLEVHNSVVPFTSHGKLHEFGAEKPISWPKPAHFDLFTITFTVWRHILSTDGISCQVQAGRFWCTMVASKHWPLISINLSRRIDGGPQLLHQGRPSYILGDCRWFPGCSFALRRVCWQEQH